ncbi:MAG TPA: tetratricopeptide repeat protein, partial [Pyrinomonadaceae bacterium]|nr:tetratricopeptide repeat protein [Pyrinomonadaceae bacterium]
MIKSNFPKFNRLLALLVLFLPLTLFAQETIQKPAATPVANSRFLLPERKTESKITGGETQEFAVVLAENEFARVAYEKLFNQLDVGVYNPQGELIAQVGFSQLKSIVFAARRAGEYRVRFKASLKPGDTAAYFITLAEKRPVKTGDENLIKAQTLFAEAAEITRQASLESRETGIIKYRQAAEIWLAANETAAAGAAFNSLGVIQFQLSRFSDALKSYEQAGRLLKPGSFEQAIALGNSGAAQLSFGNLQKAFDAYNEALPAIKAEKEHAIEALFLNNIGKIYERADSPRAMEFYEQALAAALKTNDARAEATIRVNTGGRLVDLRQYERAAALFKR